MGFENYGIFIFQVEVKKSEICIRICLEVLFK